MRWRLNDYRMNRPNVCLRFPALLLLLLSDVTTGTYYDGRSTEDILRLSSGCPSIMVRLDQFDRVELTSKGTADPRVLVPANVTCSAHYVTGHSGQGICVEKQFLNIENTGVQLNMFTSRFGPEKAFNSIYQKFDKYCTREPTLTFELSSSREFHNHNKEYDFRFRITNVTRESVPLHHRMHTFKECNMSHLLQPGQNVRVSAQEYPAPAVLPVSCWLTFHTDSGEEFEEICMRVLENRTDKNCLSSLMVSGFNDRFWPEHEVLGCNDTHSQLATGKEMCSSGQTLTLNLIRTSTVQTGMTFTADVRVKKHPFWQLLSQEQSQIRVLDFVKGVTYFVAVFDCLTVILAAMLAAMFRNPKSFWKNWAESFRVPEKCEHVHYEDSYGTMSTSRVDDITEVKSY